MDFFREKVHGIPGLELFVASFIVRYLAFEWMVVT